MSARKTKPRRIRWSQDASRSGWYAMLERGFWAYVEEVSGCSWVWRVYRPTIGAPLVKGEGFSHSPRGAKRAVRKAAR